jgi:hypothetical protein
VNELERCRATGKADCVKALADEVQRGGIAAWKSIRDLLPRDEDASKAPPSFNFGQVLIAAHKRQQVEQEKKEAPLVIDAAVESVATRASDEEVEW